MADKITPTPLMENDPKEELGYGSDDVLDHFRSQPGVEVSVSDTSTTGEVETEVWVNTPEIADTGVLKDYTQTSK